MRRRALLATLASVGAVGAAGCIEDSTGGAPGKTTDGTTDRQTDDSADPGTDDGTNPRTADGATDEEEPTESAGEDFSPEDAEQVGAVELGDRDTVAFPSNNHSVTIHVWNDADEERTFDVAVAATAGDGRHIERSTLPADAYTTLTLHVPTTYSVAVATEDEVLYEHSVTVDDFECNDGYTVLQVREDFSVESGGLSTTMSCTAPEVRAAGFGVSSGKCASGEHHRSTVTYDGEAVTVDGSFVTPNPCYGIEFEENSYDAQTDTLELTVATTPPEDDEVCTDCVGEVDYQTSVEFENDLPGHVVVTHRTDEDVTEVARATRNADVDLDPSEA